ncbi:Putative FAD-binding domain, FAD/NAD(P)-binding domain superfamily [Septoria linicola]|uniref:FAD-binding domain, FAD/NAD(P)-binding domain superfamily n=1 Tax=Septoria linicola TaxID=215465 RepID=A0A9Q9AUE3_9PEZI|nr:Putative FAD-binding domain, FAD/NAD(P)-binding domain superfamily [Septoria linicola]
MASSTQFQIIIVGGGIAGLSAAIALRAPKRQITVLEQSRLHAEIGATLSLQPNASRILSEQWKLSADESAIARGTIDHGFRVFNTEGEKVNEIMLKGGKYGAERMMYHRQDLHEALKAVATSTERSGLPAVIRVSSKVLSCDCTAGTVELQSGETLQANLVIAADGIHSAVRSFVLGETINPKSTGLSAYRLKRMLETYAEFPEWVKGPWKIAGDIGLWQLRDIDPLKTWTKGRVILIRDAAHAMLPTQGQGASQSVEDAEALGAFFESVIEVPGKDDIEAILQQVFKSRYERASLIQRYSRDAARPATELGSKEVKIRPDEFMDYNCSYTGAKNWILQQELLQASA